MTGTRTRVLVLGTFAVLVTVGMLPISAGTARAADPSAEFDWSMPPRTGLDANHDGVLDTRLTPLKVDPPSWRVNFDACDSVASDGASIVRYTWLIDRQPVGDGQGGPECRGFHHQFPEEGVYEITLETLDSAGIEAHVIKDVPVQDWLVVALGDSYASGQGNPDIPIPGFRFADAERARAAYNDAVRDLGDAGGAYDVTADRISLARTRYNQLLTALDHQADVCNIFSPNADADACLISAPEAVADATVRLATALADLGLEALIGTLGLIEESLDDLLAVADAALDLAQDAVTDAREAFEGAEEALAPTWQDRRCNRSSIAGEAQAALALEESDPRTSVTLVHLACSGAQINEGLIGGYAGVEVPDGAPDLPPQVDRAESLIGGREVDAVIMSIGGNDLGFGPIAEACIFQDPCHEPPTSIQAAIELQVAVICAVHSLFDDDCVRYFSDMERVKSAAEILASGAATLPSDYADLAARLGESFPAVLAEPGRVFITEYPNALDDDDGAVCNSESHPDPLQMLPGVSAEEGFWLRDTVNRGINEFVQAAATDHAWTYVGGIFDDFAGHGYCADDGWLRRIQDSFQMQGTKEGTIHPTPEGHAVYAEHIFDALQAELYQPRGGTPDLRAPRTPNLAYSEQHDAAPPVVTGVPDRAPNAAGWYSASVTIDWQATDPAPSSGTPTDPADTLASTEGSGVVYTSDESCDPIDRCATGSLALSIDTTPPGLACQAPAPVFSLGAAATVSAAVSDNLSGPVATTVSGAADVSSVGAKTVALTGLDAAGNERTVNCAYTVAYVFGGFMSPVDEGGVLNVVKAGRAIPLKWHLTDASGAAVTGLATAAVTVQGFTCSAGTTSDLVEETLAGGSGLQNLGDGLYQLNWKTPSTYAGSCKTMRLDFGEGLVHTALFKFTK